MEQRLRQIMSNIFGIGEDEITDDSSIHTIENWDSLSHIYLILSLEEQFGISVSEDEMIEMTKVAGIKRILKSRNV